MSASAPLPQSREEAFRGFFRSVGFRTDYLARFFGGVTLLSINALSLMLQRPVPTREIVRQMYFVGIKSLPIVGITSVFVGMVLALQFAYGLERFGADLYVGKLVVLGLFREMGPVLMSLLVGGKVGAGFTAEIGSMAVTEQVDAIRALGANPVKKLVVPRMIATTLILPLLAAFADIIGIFGGLIVCMGDVGMSAQFYYTSITESARVGDLMHGIVKTIFFGFAIGVIGCFQGLRTTGGTEGVGQSTTVTVVMISITILISDFFLSKLFWIL